MIRNYSVCIPKEESATTVSGEKPIWIDISEDRLLDALEFCRDQILNDKRSDLVVLYDSTLPESLIRQVQQLKTPRTEGGGVMISDDVTLAEPVILNSSSQNSDFL